jgi:hypothetical protein
MSGSTRSSGFSVTIGAVDNATKTVDNINRSIAKMRAPADAMTKSFDKLTQTSGLQALSHHMQGVAESSGRAFESISRMVAPLGIITGGASIAGLSRLVARFATMGLELTTAGARSRTSASDLASWEQAATLAGSSADAMGAGVKNLNDNMFHALQGTAQDAVVAFKKLASSLRTAITACAT